MATAPERFLPVEQVVRTLLEEEYPNLNTSPGSAISDVFITPASVLLQRSRDTLRVIQRNQSLRNYPSMLPEELDRLASNFLVERRAGTSAVGVQRVIFNDSQDVLITPAAQFTDGTLVFRPVTTTRLTAVELAANRLSNTNQYFVDVVVASEGSGLSTNAPSGTISTVTGIIGATRTFNLQDFTGGNNVESNSELYARILKSQTNRELVKKDSISATLLETFPTVKSLVVQGYGDPFMDRDVVNVLVDNSTIFPASFCQKVNLPLTEDGEVLWNTTDLADAAALGGFVGALVDTTGLDFSDVRVTPDGRNEQRICIQQGQKVRFLSTLDTDTAENDHTITRVETVPIEAGGLPVQIIRLAKPLSATEEIISQPERYPYTVLGLTNQDDFHVGGKVDVYLDTSGEVTREVTITNLPAVVAGSDVAEIPISSSFLDSFGNSLFENNVGFADDILYIEKVEQLDPSSGEVLLTLLPDDNFSLVRKEERSKFTFSETDLLSIRGTENITDVITGAETGTVIPRFIGQRIRITYRTNPDLSTIQTFLSDSDNRDLTKNILVKPPKFNQISMEVRYSGPATPESVVSVVTDYINSLGFGDALTASDLATVLAHFDVTQVQLPLILQSRSDTGTGRTVFVESENEIVPSEIEILRPDIISATQIL